MITTINEFKLILESIQSINEFKTIKEIEKENKMSLPKININTIYNNPILTIPKYNEINATYGKVDIKDIYPTQKFLNINNLKDTKDLDRYTNAFLIKINDKYLIQDGHHRIANRILNGDSYIFANIIFASDKINESSNNTYCKIFTSEEFRDQIYTDHKLDPRFQNKMSGGEKVFKYMQLQYDFDYKEKEVYFFGLFFNDIIVSLSHIRKSPYIENTYWLSYLCTDPLYSSNGYASQLSEFMFKWFKDNNLQFESSSYTADGMIALKPLFNKLALKYNVPFIDKEQF